MKIPQLSNTSRRCTALVLVFLFSLGMGHTRLDAADVERLDTKQMLTVLNEAEAAYSKAIAEKRTDPTAAADSFTRAADRFELLIDAGVVNGKLLYDLGNTYFQMDDLGKAILNYRRAELLLGNDANLEYNLEQARSAVTSQLPRHDADVLYERLLFWHHDFSFSLRLTIFAICWIALWAVLYVCLRRPVAYWNYWAGCCFTIALLFGASLAYDLYATPGSDQGVILSDDIVVRKGDSEGYEPKFNEQLNAGVEFDLLESRPNWLHIELTDGQSGWIPATDAAMISMVFPSNPKTT